MCRNNIYFKGMRKYKQKWEEERKEQQFAEIFTTNLHETLMAINEDPIMRIFSKKIIDELEKDYNKFKDMVDDPNDLQYLLENPWEGKFLGNKVPIFYEKANQRRRSKIVKKQHNYHRNR